MKYGKELSRRAVPEWQSQYFDYEEAKKKIKSVSKALRDVPKVNERSPLVTGRTARYATSFRAITLPGAALNSNRDDDDDLLIERRTDTAEWREYRLKELDFTDYLDQQLAKIETFYSEKEQEFKKDLDDIREQLKILRRYNPANHGVYSTALRRVNAWEPIGAQRDYSSWKHEEVPYHYAKRQLKEALAEAYRGLELVKGFTEDNEKAFQKIVKKYNKNVRAEGGERLTYLDKVNDAHFVTSTETQALMDDVEDLYAEFLENGNHKAAARKLRPRKDDTGTNTASFSRAVAFIVAGLVFGVQGIVYGFLDLNNADLRGNTEYLLQLYAGLFLTILMAIIFALAVKVFQMFKINYTFIFEFDKNSALQWQNLLEIPSWFLFLTGLSAYLNFTLKAGGSWMYTQWPLITVTFMVVVYVFPWLPFFKARLWLLLTMFRILFSGIARVGFGEFFLGDILTSLTYTLGNISLFFCLYTSAWTNNSHCNSSHSRLLGFFTTIPTIWRALQCLRRAGLPWKKSFAPRPHLFNFVKYSFTLAQLITLSVYRVNKTPGHLAAYCVFAALTTIYSTMWDILVDWSLATSPRAYPLREILVYKQKWIYCVALPLDGLLRCSWLAYVVWRKDVQHSSIVAFAVALGEVFRRGMWILLRIENEQATNTGQALAFKVRRLPFNIPPPEQVDGAHDSAAAETQTPPVSALTRLGSGIGAAHVKDYVRRRPVGWEGEESDEE